MSVGRKTGSKPLAFITSLMVLFALVIPFVGTALANHTNNTGNDVQRIDAGADDSAPANTCNQFTVTAFGDPNDNTPAEGETVDILATQSDADQTSDLKLSFCDPDGTGPATDLSGGQAPVNSGQQTQGNNAGARVSDCDDNAGPNDSTGTTIASACGTLASGENPAQVTEECQVDANGQCSFGLQSNETGTMTVTVFADRTDVGTCDANQRDTDASDAGCEEAFDQVVKTWTAGAGNASAIACTPTADSNPEGTRHEFQCTVTDAQGAVVPNATVQFDVTAGPNSQEIGQRTCGPTNAQGQTGPIGTENPAGSGQVRTADNGGAGSSGATCGYNDNENTDLATDPASPPGTDTITAFVNLGAQAGQPAPTNGLDAGEPSTTIQKTWVGPERTIDCEPETASNPIGTSHTVTCTVRDASGLPVQGALVDFDETGPADGGTNNSGSQDNVPTNAQGQATFTVSTNTGSATGTSTIRGDITDSPAPNDCANAAGNPAGSTAGVCFDDVTKTWTRQGAAQCNNGVDDDADGAIDFPDDPGCAAIDDNTESPNPDGEGPTRACNDGVDNDADGFVDFPNDPDCTDSFDNAEAFGGGRFETAVTIRYNRKARPPAFKGAVATDFEGCSNGRRIVLKKKRPGKDRVVGRDLSNSKGNWKIVKRRARGRYYAVAPRKQFEVNNATVICNRDTSVTITVRRS